MLLRPRLSCASTAMSAGFAERQKEREALLLAQPADQRRSVLLLAPASLRAMSAATTPRVIAAGCWGLELRDFAEGVRSAPRRRPRYSSRTTLGSVSWLLAAVEQWRRGSWQSSASCAQVSRERRVGTAKISPPRAAAVSIRRNDTASGRLLAKLQRSPLLSPLLTNSTVPEHRAGHFVSCRRLPMLTLRYPNSWLSRSRGARDGGMPLRRRGRREAARAARAVRVRRVFLVATLPHELAFTVVRYCPARGGSWPCDRWFFQY